MPAESLVLAGDTLFQGSIGRTDVPGGDAAQIARSIRGKLYTLPEETTVVAGPRQVLRRSVRRRRLNPFVRP